MIAAIGEPKIILDTSARDIASAISSSTARSRFTRAWPAFFGMEDTIQRVVSYFQHAAQGRARRLAFSCSRR